MINLKKNNYFRGASFEDRFCEYLKNMGYWALRIPPAKNGSQPFDVIACKGKDGNHKVFAFDCKTVKGKRFTLNRIEENQEMAFTYLNSCGINSSYFAIEIGPNIVYIISSQKLIKLKQEGVKSIDLNEYKNYCINI